MPDNYNRVRHIFSIQNCIVTHHISGKDYKNAVKLTICDLWYETCIIYYNVYKNNKQGDTDEKICIICI